MTTAEDILTFWFETLEPKNWYEKSDKLDSLIHERFISTHRAILAGETDHWRDTATGRLAEIIVLDQFSRNMFRDTPDAFSSDPLALALAQESVRIKADHDLSAIQRPFLYMPYMHSESIIVHDRAMELFADTPNYEYEVKHRDIIVKFDRYPHRNSILGRPSTAAEIEWMKENSGF